MPKRKSPWGESCPLQLKSHISQKEVNEGVGREANMQAVYERTMSLLFLGSRSVKLNGLPQLSSNGCPHPCKTDKEELGDFSNDWGQLRLGLHGELVRSPFKAPVKGAAKPVCLTCAFCGKPSCVDVVCWRCERVACANCQRCCSICGNIFCFLCCTVNYDSADEMVICSECSPR
ncbi:apoptosis regulatory protein Siva [Latimeria chalumnae]|uniref:Apoptosis regulatory protein Siva n=1 Tax=Latimeria chalumnae TaxID=7897 RepID=H3ADY0_LATCH|nr:PREDICTED: apoptosis regulatory protein Siva-like [Latimeria chalumnae]XP_005988870.1 PREDICTED: apoptosis regulatory protein Siva-like [Latimeria chalumnae]|eukprot:XP_005988869.1 PREDICTED: apoptosis regulatory protein Siva-like [Latimeria chalumnae]